MIIAYITISIINSLLILIIMLHFIILQFYHCSYLSVCVERRIFLYRIKGTHNNGYRSEKAIKRFLDKFCHVFLKISKTIQFLNNNCFHKSNQYNFIKIIKLFFF
ncbi:unnamed protein product [Larinioides sclopetarius]|uniref:Uncharacterized protein n=1 Tax=Larinioides sclopetarius TaxID=280406 RepID=A0AAV1ZWB6_9ARAC